MKTYMFEYLLLNQVALEAAILCSKSTDEWS